MNEKQILKEVKEKIDSQKFHNKYPVASKSIVTLFVLLFIGSVGVLADTIIRSGAESNFDDGIDLGNGNLTANVINASEINNVLYVQAGNGSDIQVKIDMAKDGQKVFLPDGNYTITDTININKKITFEGATTPSFRQSPSSSGTIINAGSGMDNKNMINISSVSGVTIRNIGLTGNLITMDGLALVGTTGGFYGENIYSELQGRDGLLASSTMDAGNSLYHVGTRGNERHGMKIERNDFRVTDYYSHRNWNGSALMLSPGGGTQLTTMHSFYNNYSIYLNGTDNANLINLELESNNFSALYFDSSYSPINHILTQGIYYKNNCPTINCVGGDGVNDNVITFDAETNGIDGVSIFGSSFDSSAKVFNTTESSGGDIEDVFFTGSVYYGGLGNYTDGFDILSINDANTYLSLLSLRLRLENNKPIQLADTSGAYSHFANRFTDNSTYVYSAEKINGGILDLRGWTGSNWNNRITLDGTINKTSILGETIQFGEGTTQQNITLTSPNGSEYSCGVENGGTFICS